MFLFMKRKGLLRCSVVWRGWRYLILSLREFGFRIGEEREMRMEAKDGDLHCGRLVSGTDIKGDGIDSQG